MSETILEVTNLTKYYGRTAALDKVSITIQRGMIYGLIGENGAGKSTFMRAVMGLISVAEGEISLFGARGTRGLQAARRRMGQSIEIPALYPELTAVDNLRIQAASGGVSERRIPELLALMNLSDTGSKKVKNFSLGMRQRLAIAVTLITDPEFLILDEPINGLDPAGIVEMREIIRKLVTTKGLTVLISSHLLDELSHLATNYGILHHGRLLRELSKEELQQESRRYIRLETPQSARALPVLDHLRIHRYAVTDSSEIRIYERLEEVALINRALVNADIEVQGISLAGQSLEEYFMQLTK